MAVDRRDGIGGNRWQRGDRQERGKQAEAERHAPKQVLWRRFHEAKSTRPVRLYLGLNVTY
jgi:hypothetical protein